MREAHEVRCKWCNHVQTSRGIVAFKCNNCRKYQGIVYDKPIRTRVKEGVPNVVGKLNLWCAKCGLMLIKGHDKKCPKCGSIRTTTVKPKCKVVMTSML